MFNIKFYDIKQLAEIIGVSTRTINTYIKDEKLKATKIGGKWKVKEEDLKKYLNIK